MRVPHPFPHLLYIDKYGSPSIHSKNIEELIQHDTWVYEACDHEAGVLVQHWLGGGGGIRSLQDRFRTLSSEPEAEYPLIWKRVIYNSTHCGDFIPVDDLEALRQEVIHAQQIGLSNLGNGQYRSLQHFLQQMEELVEAALSVRKPIVF